MKPQCHSRAYTAPGILFVMALATMLLFSPRAAGFAGGDGTANNPYLVATAEHLDAVRTNLSAHFRQTADIDLGVAPWNEGEGWVPIGEVLAGQEFKGVFQGGGFAVSNLTINRPEIGRQGLFGYASQANFSQIRMRAIQISGGDYSGGVVGQAINSQLQDIHVEGSVAGRNVCGGLVGGMIEGGMSLCVGRAVVSGQKHVGGMAGLALGAKLSRLSSLARVEGEQYTGGIVGTGRSATYSPNNAAEYLPGTPAAATQVPESKTWTSPLGEAGAVELSDGTRVEFEAMPGAFEVALHKKSEVDPEMKTTLDESQLEWTGSPLQITFTTDTPSERLSPVLILPVSECGSIDPQTINVLRVSQLWRDGELVENSHSVLPITLDDKGDVQITDHLFFHTMAPAPEASMALAPSKKSVPSTPQVAARMAFVGSVRYHLVSFQKALNWAVHPRLVRMNPQMGAGRMEADPPDISKPKAPVVNIVVLVHGHNEVEYDGFQTPNTAEPWKVGYKKLVWDLLYESFKNGKNYPKDSTLLYEFVYPTYRPIFSPVPENGWIFEGSPRQTLGESFAELLQKEFKDNPQLAAMLRENMDFNLFVVAHSQGGLVARAGMRLLDEKLKKKMRHFVSWGSPHNGAPLYTLRYLLEAGHNLTVDSDLGHKVVLPLSVAKYPAKFLSSISGKYIDVRLHEWHSALHTPGILDMRWDSSHKNLIDLQNRFPSLKDETKISPAIFSDNLKKFNENNVYEPLGYNSGYTFFVGTTGKSAALEIDDVDYGGWWLSYRVGQFGKFMEAKPIEKGASLNKMLIVEAHAQNDGAVPVFSQKGAGIAWYRGPPKIVELPDMDHEEFYGSEPEQRSAATIAKGRTVAEKTFETLAFDTSKPEGESRKAPTGTYEIVEEDGIVRFSGLIEFPLYKSEHKGDGKPGRIVKRIEARGRVSGNLVDSAEFQIQDDGSFRGEMPSSQMIIEPVNLVAVLKDDSEFNILYLVVHNLTKNIKYPSIQDAVNAASGEDHILVPKGTYYESLTVDKNVHIEGEGPDATVLQYDVVFEAGSDGAIMEGFMIEGGLPEQILDTTVFIQDCSPILTGNVILCRIKGIGDFGHPIASVGIRIGTTAGTNQPQIVNNNIRGGGVGIAMSGSAMVKNNTIHTNLYVAGPPKGLFDSFPGERDRCQAIIIGTGNPVVEGNTIAGSCIWIENRDDDRAVLKSNHVTDSPYGIKITEGSGTAISANIIQNCGIGIIIQPWAINVNAGVLGWERYATVQKTIDSGIVDIVVPRHSPPFPENTNTYINNGPTDFGGYSPFGAYGPGLDNFVTPAGYNVYVSW